MGQQKSADLFDCHPRLGQAQRSRPAAIEEQHFLADLHNLRWTGTARIIAHRPAAQ